MSRIPSPSRRLMSLFIAAPFVAVACTSAADEGATDAAVSAAPSEAAATAAPTTEAAAPTTEAAAPTTEAAVAEAAAWLDIELTDAETGETFTLASLAGDVVAIEPMAIWCGNCKAQQDNVKEAYADIESDGVRYISLGIDPGEDPDALARYAEKRGYEWTFVQSPIEFSRAINDDFGAQVLSAPSTPLIVLDAEGGVVTQTVGFHGPEQLLALLDEAGA